MILDLGSGVIGEAARQAARWRDAGLEDLPIAVNLSPREFRNPGLAERIARIVQRAGASPEGIGFEITESTVLHDTDAVIDELRELRQAGFCVALDDFGTGYSSLSYLRRLPVDTVKIDRSFIQDIECRDDAAALTASIIQMTKALGLKTVAEGVEEEGQRALLRDWKCDEFQGFLFSRPVDAASAEALLGRSPAATNANPTG